ncbi:TatD family hydrolase [Motiliproteus sediminis]|uniref:TatD family hydrolase n=1 Tax=Motiliproteus sediminis TaxID=1468178 RepID=UPI001AEF3F47|nr:TatD family hydrolase [Motiliproteus sediminis]
MLVDSHCHLDRLQLADQPDAMDAIIARSRDAGVERILCVATDLACWPSMMDVVAPYPEVFASAGVHPLSDEIALLTADSLLEQVGHPRVVAVGETGLDYHYGADTRAAQLEAFRLHLRVANEVGKPVIVHTREAQQDTLALLREHASLKAGGVLHCFTESWEMAEQALALGLHISFSGIITFRNAAPLRDVVRQTPLDRLLVETDAPYLTPAPYRGRSNEPQYVRRVAECIAEVKQLSVDAVIDASGSNFQRLFPGAA